MQNVELNRGVLAGGFSVWLAARPPPLVMCPNVFCKSGGHQEVTPIALGKLDTIAEPCQRSSGRLQGSESDPFHRLWGGVFAEGDVVRTFVDQKLLGFLLICGRE